MRYYKLINGTNFVGIGTSYDMLRYQSKHRVLLRCDVSEAQYIRYRDQLYRATWMIPETANIESINLEIIEIDVSEYDALASAIETEEEIVVPQITEPPEVEDFTPDVTIEYMREMKIAEMSYKCNRAIESGFDAVLSDGKTYHFSLTTQDQINLLSLSTMIANGMTMIPYHADGELCTYYSDTDMLTVITLATQYKTYHTSYFNSLKNWIVSMETMEEIGEVDYGVSVPEEYCSIVLHELTTAATNGG